MTPTPPASDPEPTRAAQFALAVLASVALGVLAFRSFGPSAAARPTEFRPAAAPYRIDLNRAGRAELLQIPNVGPSLADAILSHRAAAGRFATVDELDGVNGVGAKTLDKLRPFVRVEGPAPDDEPDRVETLQRKPTPPVVRAAPPSGEKLRPGDPPLDVNTASAEELQRLPGVGTVLAQRIIETRQAKPFGSVDDLRRVKGVGVKTLDKLRPFVVVK